MWTDPDVKSSFRRAGPGRYVSRSMRSVSCPPCVIARLVRDMPDGPVTWPGEYTRETWDALLWACGWYDEDAAVSARQAGELAGPARQILELHGKGELELASYQRQSVQHFLEVIASP